MPTTLTMLGNEGFRIESGNRVVLIDAFYQAIPGVAGAPCPGAPDEKWADLILVTHAHWDHFNAAAVAAASRRTGATVVGPRSVIAALRKALPASALAEMEPAPQSGAGRIPALKRDFPAAAVSAFRTEHGREHNSYLLELPGFRCFHDGDNEKTQRLDGAALGKLDALLIGPWQGSGWVEFIERLAPRRYFLMHLTEEELDQHARNRFLPDLCDHVPAGLVVLRPGESFVMDNSGVRPAVGGLTFSE
jgi:L-ascorbate metabolism protein UlaG (beta-lactamase superfamily)